MVPVPSPGPGLLSGPTINQMLSDQTRALSEGLCVSVVKQQVWEAGDGGGCCLAASGSRCHPVSHLIQEALHQDNQGEGHGMQTEEDIVNLHGVHSVRVLEEKLLLLGVRVGGETE